MFLKSVESHWDKFETVLDGISVLVKGIYSPAEPEVGLGRGFEVRWVMNLVTKGHIQTTEKQDEALEQEYFKQL